MAVLKTIIALAGSVRLGRFMPSLLSVIVASHSMIAQPMPEYQVKAAFVFNFTQFVEWPAKAFHAADAPFVIGILGTDPFGSYLDDMIAGESAGGHPLIVQRFDRVTDVKVCHILFISISEKDVLKDTFASLGKRSILTVGDAANFAKSGGMIRFYTEKNKIRIRINLTAAKENELSISSKLLRMADIVH